MHPSCWVTTEFHVPAGLRTRVFPCHCPCLDEFSASVYTRGAEGTAVHFCSPSPKAVSLERGVCFGRSGCCRLGRGVCVSAPRREVPHRPAGPALPLAVAETLSLPHLRTRTENSPPGQLRERGGSWGSGQMWEVGCHCV